MSIEIWIAFSLAALLVLVIPGPTIILVMSQAVVHGRKAVLPLVCGVVLGDLSAMTFSLLGLGAVLATSATLFSILKWGGAVYLVYLGIRMIISHPGNAQFSKATSTSIPRSMLRKAYIVTALNPKGIVFFIAFMPQFISPGSESFLQLIVLGLTFLVLASLNALFYALFAGQLRELLHSRKMCRVFNLTGGGALVSAGFVTAAIEQ